MKKTKIITLLFALAVLFSFACAHSFAEEVAPEEAESAYNAVINDFDSIYYNDGETVFNNFGTVYNNSGTVYNNGGTVFNNGGTVYNNSGKVFNNSGTVYNNGGEVLGGGEGCEVYEATMKLEDIIPAELPEASEAASDVEETAEEAPELSGEQTEEPMEVSVYPGAYDDRFRIKLAGDYSPFAYIEGPDRLGGEYLMDTDSKITITTKPGFTLTNSAASTGRCLLQEDGSIIFTGAERDGLLYLNFKVDSPVIKPEFGAYGEAQTVSILAAKGVTVHYTTDGSIVNEDSAVYESPIEVASSVELQVMASAQGAESSSRITGRYLIPIITAPCFDPVNSGYDSIEPKPIEIVNNGLDKLWIDSVKLTGSDAGFFELSTGAGGRINPGQSDSSTWTVAPKDGLSPGTYKTTAEFTFDNGCTANVEITFTVNK